MPPGKKTIKDTGFFTWQTVPKSAASRPSAHPLKSLLPQSRTACCHQLRCIFLKHNCTKTLQWIVRLQPH